MKQYRIIKREQDGTSKPCWDIESSIDGEQWDWVARFDRLKDAKATLPELSSPLPTITYLQ